LLYSEDSIYWKTKHLYIKINLIFTFTTLQSFTTWLEMPENRLEKMEVYNKISRIKFCVHSEHGKLTNKFIRLLKKINPLRISTIIV